MQWSCSPNEGLTDSDRLGVGVKVKSVIVDALAEVDGSDMGVRYTMSVSTQMCMIVVYFRVVNLEIESLGEESLHGTLKKNT